MLENMTDEQRFQLTAKLCSEVLAPVVDGLVTFDPEAAAVLQDTLVVLASKVRIHLISPGCPRHGVAFL